jgi:hypothetical protein
MPTFNEIKGKTILVGITYMEDELTGKIKSRRRFFGTITGAGVVGIKIKSPDGSFFTLPPDLNALMPAPKGKYPVRLAGNKTVYPDYISTWRLVEKDDSN